MSHHTHSTNCGCTNLVSPCTASTGCLSTNYAKCIYYSGDTLTGCVALTSGENLDVSLGKIVDAICALTPDDLAWNTFDYACLDSYTSAQEFAEGISAAHCSLVDDVEDIQTPTFILCSLFTSGAYEITPGTTTIQQILGFYASILCNVNSLSADSISITNGCFTEITTETSLSDYFQWVVDNTCSIRTAVLASIAGVSNRVTAIQNYVGAAGTISSGHDNSDCLGGGASDTAYATIELLKSKVCEIDATVDLIPDLANIALTWAPCFYSNTAQTLLTQLGRIVSTLKAVNFQFDAGDFTVTPAACGPTISLNGVAGFTCSDLETCSIHYLEDVTDTADISGDTGGSLTYDYALGYYRPIRHVITVTTPAAPLAATGPNPLGAEIVTTLNANAANLSRNFAINFRENAWLDLTPFVGTYTTAGTGDATPMIMKTWDRQIKFRGEFYSGGGAAALYELGGAGQPLNEDSGVQIFSSITADYRPSQLTSIFVPIKYQNTLTDPNAYVVMGELIFNPITGHIKLYTRDQNYLMANIAGASGTDEYLGNYFVSLFGTVINI